MKKPKLTLEQRQALAARQKYGWRAMTAAVVCWIVAVILQPMGITGSLGPHATQARLTASLVFGTISLLGAIVAMWGLRPWKGKGMRRWALALTLLAILLGDLYVVSLYWRI